MLVSQPITRNDHGPMLDRNNIINVRDGESLYQICLKLIRRLAEVPGFKIYLDLMEEQEAEGSDPVSSLWQCFRSGLPLLAIYNASQPDEGDLVVDTNKPEYKIGKEAAYLFIKACMQQMKIPTSDTFTLTDLYSDNTTGFVKVTKTVNRVLDLLHMSGKLHPSIDSDDSREGTDSGNPQKGKTPMTRREYILRELVETETQYVHHLLNLQALKKELEEIGSLTGDAIHMIFLNLNNLLDFAQRFLIRVEQQNELPKESQNWGKLFIHYKEPFRQYEPFIANQRRCEITCQKEWDKMVATKRGPLMEQMLANPTILNGFLLKPFQRLTKYPMLLKDLMNQTEEEDLKADLAEAIEIIQDVLHLADDSIDKDTRDEAVRDLQDRVDDWKSLNLNNFGELLLLGTFSVLKDGGMREQEKEYHIYLFKRILIMCKEINVNKQKNKIMGAKERATLSLRGKPRMHLKGRIFLINVSHVISSSGPGNYLIQIVWKGDPSTENFVIKFKNDETMRRWNREIEEQRQICMNEAKQGLANPVQFTGLDISGVENPYQEADDEDYSRLSSTTFGGSEITAYSEFNMSRNASLNNLRSRSATAGSQSSSSTAHNSIGRNGRYMISELGGLPPLNTKLSREVQSPGDFAGGSYFSPVERETTPPSMSTRSSTQSANAGYHRIGNTLASTPRAEDSYRNTAPAMVRNIPGGNGNPYVANGRSATRPSLPPGAVQAANQTGNRNRSASSPDFNPLVQQNRKYISGDNAPTVPPIPAHVAKQMAPPHRGMNASPSNMLPIRNTNSPHPGSPPYGLPSGPRPTLNSHTYTYDQSYSGHIDHRKMGNGVVSLTTSLADKRLSPQVSSPSSDGEPFMPSQLRAKVRFDENYVSMIIPSNIQFRSLTDRIDAKLARFTNHSIASGSVRLRYRDDEGDFIWIDSDEAVHNALLDWRETNVDKVVNGQYAEILLYAHSIHGEPAGG